jgi:CelD/BcsL family acetyltransferase involved in cellulose biosynthesis
MIEVSELSGAAIWSLAEEWRALFDSVEDASPFQSWEWVSSYWYEAGGGRPWILCARDQGRLVGLLPLVIAPYRGLPLRRLSFLAAPLSDYQELLALPEHRAACSEGFVRLLAQHTDRWDLIDLTDVPEDSQLIRAAIPGYAREIAHHRVCPYVPLPPTWDEYRATLGRNLRASLGRKRRKLERELGARLDLAAGAEVLPTMEALFELHDHRWRRRGLSGAFADPRVRRLHRRVAPLFAARGWLRLHRLVAGDRICAVYYCFQRNGRVYYYLSGFDRELERLSVGVVLLGQVIATAIAEGARELDFLRGDENYKYDWKPRERSTVRMVVRKPTLSSSAAQGVNRIERRLEQLGSRLRNQLWGRR